MSYTLAPMAGTSPAMTSFWLERRVAASAGEIGYMPKVTIDGQEIEVAAGTTILQACQQVGVEIAHFCYHERLAIAGQLPDVPGGGREIAQAGGLLRRCRLPRAMSSTPNRRTAIKARHGVMEMLLINHPLDCPIWRSGRRVRSAGPGDGLRVRPRPFRGKQAGGARQGSGSLGRDEHEPLHPLHALHPLSDRNRRGRELGATGRGEAMEITTYVEKALGSELSAISSICARSGR